MSRPSVKTITRQPVSLRRVGQTSAVNRQRAQPGLTTTVNRRHHPKAVFQSKLYLPRDKASSPKQTRSRSNSKALSRQPPSPQRAAGDCGQLLSGPSHLLEYPPSPLDTSTPSDGVRFQEPRGRRRHGKPQARRLNHAVQQRNPSASKHHARATLA